MSGIACGVSGCIGGFPFGNITVGSFSGSDNNYYGRSQNGTGGWSLGDFGACSSPNNGCQPFVGIASNYFVGSVTGIGTANNADFTYIHQAGGTQNSFKGVRVQLSNGTWRVFLTADCVFTTNGVISQWRWPPDLSAAWDALDVGQVRQIEWLR